MEIKNLVSNDVAQTVEDINELYRNGEIKGLTVQIALKEGTFITGSCGDISFLEKLGLIESAKHNLVFQVNELNE